MYQPPDGLPIPFVQLNMIGREETMQRRGIEVFRQLELQHACRLSLDYHPDDTPSGNLWSHVAPATYILGTEGASLEGAKWLQSTDTQRARVHVLSFTSDTLDPSEATWIDNETGESVPPPAFVLGDDYRRGLTESMRAADAVLCSYETAVKLVRKYNRRAFYVPDVTDLAGRAVFLRHLTHALYAAREHRASRFRLAPSIPRADVRRDRKTRDVIRREWRKWWLSAADRLEREASH